MIIDMRDQWIQVGSILARYVHDCEICQGHKARGEAPHPAHYNCLYGGKAMGHREGGHCTANACY